MICMVIYLGYDVWCKYDGIYEHVPAWAASCQPEVIVSLRLDLFMVPCVACWRRQSRRRSLRRRNFPRTVRHPFAPGSMAGTEPSSGTRRSEFQRCHSNDVALQIKCQSWNFLRTGQDSVSFEIVLLHFLISYQSWFDRLGEAGCRTQCGTSRSSSPEQSAFTPFYPCFKSFQHEYCASFCQVAW